eukprot:4243692-Pyramimonas_sp.AAC.1
MALRQPPGGQEHLESGGCSQSLGLLAASKPRDVWGRRSAPGSLGMAPSGARQGRCRPKTPRSFVGPGNDRAVFSQNGDRKL